MSPLDVTLALVALLGHAAICVGVLNRSHAMGMPRVIVKAITALSFLWLPLGPSIALAPLVHGGSTPAVLQAGSGGAGWWLAYLIPCWIAAAVVVVPLGAAGVARQAAQTFDFKSHARGGYRRAARASAGAWAFWRTLTRLPGNQDLTVHLHDESLCLARLDPALDGLSVLHLSDFHFTGRLGKEFFQEIVRLAIETPPDLIALTGDFVDNADCIEWIPDTLGALKAPHGVYFVLGNHDPRMKQVPRLRRALVEAGFVDLAGRWMPLQIKGRPIVLAGNEMPWLPRPQT